MKKLIYVAAALLCVASVLALPSFKQMKQQKIQIQIDSEMLTYLSLTKEIPQKFQELDKRIIILGRKITMLKINYNSAKGKLTPSQKNMLDDLMEEIDYSFAEINGWVSAFKEEYDYCITNYDVNDMKNLYEEIADIYWETNQLAKLIDSFNYELKKAVK